MRRRTLVLLGSAAALTLSGCIVQPPTIPDPPCSSSSEPGCAPSPSPSASSTTDPTPSESLQPPASPTPSGDASVTIDGEPIGDWVDDIRCSTALGLVTTDAEQDDTELMLGVIATDGGSPMAESFTIITENDLYTQSDPVPATIADGTLTASMTMTSLGSDTVSVELSLPCS